MKINYPLFAGAFVARAVGVTFASATLCSAAFAQTDPALPPVVVTGQRAGSLTAPDSITRRQQLEQNTGSVGFVDSESFARSYAGNLREVLKDTPGVFIESRYGQEVRLSVRGSGLSRAFHTRGIEILQDGVPTNLADGSGDFYQIDPLGLRSAEVYKGGNALAFGASTLGGAIDFITPTARTAIAPNLVRVEGGSYGTLRTSAQVSRAYEKADFLINASVGHADGYRAHMAGDYKQFNVNFGYRLDADKETRFYFGVYDVRQKLPGTLTLNDALNNPRMAAASALSGDQARNQRAERIANVTSWRVAGGQLDLSSWLIHKSLYHPIFQVIDQDGSTWGISPKFTVGTTLAGLRNEVVVGGRYFAGTNEALQYVNNASNRGAQTLNAKQRASNIEAWIENRTWVQPELALTVGVKAYRQTRRYNDYGGLATNPLAKSDDRTYDGANPKVGLLWQPVQTVQAFLNLTRSADTPDFSDLAQTIGTTQRFVPLAAQHAWTIEAGTRGSLGRFAWDVTAWRSAVRDQLLQFTTNSSVPAATFNAGKTTLQGIEFGASAELMKDLLSPGRGDRVVLSQLWNYSDFRFDGDAQYGSNRLPVVPVQVLRTKLAYEQPAGLRLAATLDWVPRGAWVDYANTQRAPGYTLIGLQASYDVDKKLTLFVDARNLANRRTISDLGAVTDARTAATAVYYPGDGRSVFAGLRYAL